MRRLQKMIAAGLVLGAVSACQDTIIKFLGAENNPQIFVAVDSMRFEVTALDNVHDEVRVTWTNTGVAAIVHHRSFVHHGVGRISMLDAVGDTVYRFVPLEPEPLDNETMEGQAGDWTVIIELFGAKGRVDVSVVKK